MLRLAADIMDQNILYGTVRVFFQVQVLLDYVFEDVKSLSRIEGFNLWDRVEVTVVEDIINQLVFDRRRGWI